MTSDVQALEADELIRAENALTSPSPTSCSARARWRMSEAASVRRVLWDAAAIHPTGRSRLMPLGEHQPPRWRPSIRSAPEHQTFSR